MPIKAITVLEAIDLMKSGKKLKVNTPTGFQPISNWIDKGRLQTLKVQTKDRNFIKVTPEHKFFTTGNEQIGSLSGEWIKASQLKIGSLLHTKNGLQEVVSIEQIGEQQIYDLFVDHPCHCYYGNGFVNHNTGKTLIAQHAMMETQKRGGIAVLIDSEYGFQPNWFRKLGGDPDQVIVGWPDYAEQAYDMIKATIQKIREKNTEIPITVVYDSVAASPSKHEYENSAEKADMGKRASAHGKGSRLLLGETKKHNVTFIIINQLRHTFCVVPKTKVTWRKVNS